MLIYNKELSVSPLTTHLPLKKVHKKITKKKIINHIMVINRFYNKRFKKEIKSIVKIKGVKIHITFLNLSILGWIIYLQYD